MREGGEGSELQGGLGMACHPGGKQSQPSIGNATASTFLCIVSLRHRFNCIIAWLYFLQMTLAAHGQQSATNGLRQEIVAASPAQHLSAALWSQQEDATVQTIPVYLTSCPTTLLARARAVASLELAVCQARICKLPAF